MLSSHLSGAIVVALASFFPGDALAQGTANSVELNSIQEQFKNSDIVPDLISSFSPSALVNVTFPGQTTALTPGQMYSQAGASHVVSFLNSLCSVLNNSPNPQTSLKNRHLG